MGWVGEPRSNHRAWTILLSQADAGDVPSGWRFPQGAPTFPLPTEPTLQTSLLLNQDLSFLSLALCVLGHLDRVGPSSWVSLSCSCPIPLTPGTLAQGHDSMTWEALHLPLVLLLLLASGKGPSGGGWLQGDRAKERGRSEVRGQGTVH